MTDLKECVHGHKTKQVGCVSCELLHRHSSSPSSSGLQEVIAQTASTD